MEGNDAKIFTHGADGTITTKYFRNPPGQEQKYYQNVRDALLKKKPLIITGAWSRRPIHILDLAVRSAKLGKSLPAKHA
jgi:hypothetical protein